MSQAYIVKKDGVVVARYLLTAENVDTIKIATPDSCEIVAIEKEDLGSYTVDASPLTKEEKQMLGLDS